MPTELSENSSDYDIETYSKQYVDQHIGYLKNNIPRGWRDDAGLGLRALQEFAFRAVKQSCYSFINNNGNRSNRDLSQYLFPTLKYSCKSAGKMYDTKRSYSCPYCSLERNSNPIQVYKDKLTCNDCSNSLNDTEYQWEEYLFKTYSQHGKKGFKCGDCERFIPDNDCETVKCPFPDCLFVGDIERMSEMVHPKFNYNIEMKINGEYLPGKDKTDASLLVKESVELYLNVLNQCIEEQVKLLSYNSHNATVAIKACMYEAYKKIIERYPQEMISYLIFGDRGLKLQSTIFQEFISIIETKLPIKFLDREQEYKITSLMDENMSIFSGSCSFDAVIDNNREIPNNTPHIYMGSRKGTYCKPYFIGKVIDVIDTKINTSILTNVKEYSFSKIVMNEQVEPNTNVIVKHLYIAPHYQMGGLVYLNRIRRSIVDRAYMTINGKKREPHAKNIYNQF